MPERIWPLILGIAGPGLGRRAAKRAPPIGPTDRYTIPGPSRYACEGFGKNPTLPAILAIEYDLKKGGFRWLQVMAKIPADPAGANEEISAASVAKDRPM